MENLRDTLSELDDSFLFADGFDSALIGYVTIASNSVALYDRAKVIEILMKDMDYEGAEEFFEYNVQGAYVGDKTPAFATLAGQCINTEF